MTEIRYEFVSKGQQDVIDAFKSIKSAATSCSVALAKPISASWPIRLLAWFMRPLVKAFWYASELRAPVALSVKAGDLASGREGAYEMSRAAKALQDAAIALKAEASKPTSVS